MDIIAKTAALPCYLVEPALHVFKYLKHHNTSWLVMDLSILKVVWQGNPGKRIPQEKAAALEKLYPDVIDEILSWIMLVTGRPEDLRMEC
eukprot:13965212-Ditylum_brightwellii.AAC.1